MKVKGHTRSRLGVNILSPGLGHFIQIILPLNLAKIYRKQKKVYNGPRDILFIENQ